MLVKVVRNGDRWRIVALSGKLYGQVVGDAEAVRLAQPRLRSHYITGHIKRMYGVELTQEAKDDPEVLQKLVWGNPYEACHQRMAYDDNTDTWYNPDTKLDVGPIEFVSVMRDQIFYSTKEDIEKGRQVDERSIEQPPQKVTLWNKVRGFISRVRNWIGL